MDLDLGYLDEPDRVLRDLEWMCVVMPVGARRKPPAAIVAPPAPNPSMLTMPTEMRWAIMDAMDYDALVQTMRLSSAHYTMVRNYFARFVRNREQLLNNMLAHGLGIPGVVPLWVHFMEADESLLRPYLSDLDRWFVAVWKGLKDKERFYASRLRETDASEYLLRVRTKDDAEYQLFGTSFFIAISVLDEGDASSPRVVYTDYTLVCEEFVEDERAISDEWSGTFVFLQQTVDDLDLDQERSRFFKPRVYCAVADDLARARREMQMYFAVDDTVQQSVRVREPSARTRHNTWTRDFTEPRVRLARRWREYRPGELFKFARDLESALPPTSTPEDLREWGSRMFQTLID